MAQVVECRQVLAPVRIEDLQHDVALVLAERSLGAGRQLGVVGRLRFLDDAREQGLVLQVGFGFKPAAQRQLEVELGLERGFEAGDVPLLLDAFVGNVHAEHVVQHAAAQVGDARRDIARLEHLVPQGIDGPALVVADVVVLEQLLADVEVPRFDFSLRALDRARHHGMLDRLAFGHLQHHHDAVDALAGEDAQQRVLERHVEARAARVALPPGAAAQLVVDAARFVALGADDVQAAGLYHLVVQRLPLAAQLVDADALFLRRQVFRRLDQIALLLDVAAEHDVGAAPRHVGCDGDHLRAAGLRHDLGLARVLLGVQHLVRQLFLAEQPGDQLRVLDRGGADEHRLVALVAVADVLDHRLVPLHGGAVHLVLAVVAHHRHVGRDHHRLESVDLLELVGLGVRGAGHAGELAVHAEVVLEGDRGERLVLVLDRDVLLRLDRLVQAVGPAPPLHQAPGELIDDHHLAVLHHIVLVAVEQVVRTQRRVEVMHQVDVGRFVEARARGQHADAREDLLGFLVAGLRHDDLVVLLVDEEVARRLGLVELLLFLLPRQQRRHLVHLVIDLGAVLGLARDDERRAGFINQDRVDLVDDGIGEAALKALLDVHRHVVAQVVEVLGLHVRQVDADRKPQEVEDLAHPLGVAPRQVVVHRDDVNAFAGQRVEVRG